MKKIKKIVFGAPKLKNNATEFMIMCYEGCTREQLDDIFLAAEKTKSQQSDFKDCIDHSGNKPWHKAAKHSNAVALQWIIDKWKEMEWPLRFDQ